MSFYDVTMSARWAAPILEDQDIFVRHLPQNLSGMGGETIAFKLDSLSKFPFCPKRRISHSPLIQTHVVTYGQRSTYNII